MFLFLASLAVNKQFIFIVSPQNQVTPPPPKNNPLPPTPWRLMMTSRQTLANLY